ncbi:hypothetical protein HMPREF1109_0786 [Streptococcus intermedius SK54 = ATCC 27335]|nr:hypothetical protein HMPREF1109_0786 [Streptococcus intermedius SK54 = ATCC 27335]
MICINIEKEVGKQFSASFVVNLISSFKVAFRYIMASESDSRKLVLL